MDLVARRVLDDPAVLGPKDVRLWFSLDDALESRRLPAYHRDVSQRLKFPSFKSTNVSLINDKIYRFNCRHVTVMKRGAFFGSISR